MASPLLLQPSSTLGSKQFLTNQEKLDRTSSLFDRKHQRIRDTVGQAKRGYHSDDTDEEDFVEDRLGGSSSLAGPSRPPANELAGLDHSNNDHVCEDHQHHQMSQLLFISGSGIGSGLAGGVAPVVVRRRKKYVERVSS